MPKETKAAKRQRGELIVKRLSDIYPTKGQCLLNHSDAFTLVIAVLLSAQTTDAAVNKVTGELFSHWPDPQSMALAKATDIEAVIRSIGFYRVKAANCIKLSQILLAEHNGKVPSSMSELVKLPGVGRKTANIVLNVAFGIVDGIAVDTHVFRIAHRLGFSTKKHSTPEKVEHDLMDFFEKKNWGTINHQWVLFGREFCDARRPQCAKCPIGDLCPKKI
ncbi:MAG: endonuclease III [Coriobacteriales bacterium]|nr:endonuclease III [Coriobacteriales bacterium]